MGRLEKIKEIAKEVFRDEKRTEYRYVVNMTVDGLWRRKSARLSEEAWEAFLFNLDNDPTIEIYDVIGENVVLIKRKAEKKAQESK